MSYHLTGGAGLWSVWVGKHRIGMVQRNSEGEWQGYVEPGDKHVGRFRTRHEAAAQTVEAHFNEHPGGAWR